MCVSVSKVYSPLTSDISYNGLISYPNCLMFNILYMLLQENSQWGLDVMQLDSKQSCNLIIFL